MELIKMIQFLFKENSNIIFKFIIKKFLYLCLIYTIIISLIIFTKNDNLLKSRFDPNYWIIEINKNSNTEFDEKIFNLINLSKKNNKYKSKSLLNLLYHYNKLTNKTKRELINFL